MFIFFVVILFDTYVNHFSSVVLELIYFILKKQNVPHKLWKKFFHLRCEYRNKTAERSFSEIITDF